MSAKTELRIDFKGVDKTAGTLRGIKGGISSFAMKAAGALGAAFAVSKVIGGLKDLQQGLHATGDAARKIGMDVETFQRMGFALSQVGFQAEDAAQFLGFMKKNIATKQDMAYNIFEMMGTDMAALTAMNPEQQFMSITESIAEMGNETDRVRALTEIFGRKGAELAPLLRQGPEAFSKGLKDVMGMVDVADQRAVATASDIGDAFTAVGKQMQTDFAGAFLRMAGYGEESFGNIGIAIFSFYQNAKLYVSAVAEMFVWLGEHVKSVFSSDPIAEPIKSLTDRLQENRKEAQDAIDKFQKGWESKNILAQQMAEASGQAAVLKREINGVRDSIRNFGKLELAGTYAQIQAQYGGMMPKVAGQAMNGGNGGEQGMLKGIWEGINKVVKNTAKTTDAIEEIEEF